MKRSTASLGAVLGLWVGLTAGRADDYGWRPTSAPPAVERARQVVASTPVTHVSGSPVALGRPVVAPARHLEPVFRAQAPDSVLPPTAGAAIPPPPAGPVVGTEPFNTGVVTPAAPNGNFFQRAWDGTKGAFHRNCGQPFQSDHALDAFASPVSSPFLTEDPRALTEVRPIFIYQTIPNDNPFLQGGSVEFFGLQARVAFTERLSLVMNKLGGVAFQPDDERFIPDQAAFSEVWLGPKYTFYRDDCDQRVAAAGLTFMIPTGKDRLGQGGDLGLAPYVTFATNFGKLPSGYGSFNFMTTAGYAFGTGDQRSDFFYWNFHLDFDVGGQHKLYPLIELNWTRYTSNGNKRPFDFEGGDLANFGSRNVDGNDLLTLAAGARYKMSECVQFGGAVEFPVTGNKDLFDFRVTFDVIFRY